MITFLQSVTAKVEDYQGVMSVCTKVKRALCFCCSFPVLLLMYPILFLFFFLFLFCTVFIFGNLFSSLKLNLSL